VIGHEPEGFPHVESIFLLPFVVSLYICQIRFSLFFEAVRLTALTSFLLSTLFLVVFGALSLHDQKLCC